VEGFTALPLAGDSREKISLFKSSHLST
jgi:hypothetical protein